MESNADSFAIHALVQRLADTINHHDWSALLALFSEDIVWERLPPTPWKLEGKDAIRSFLTGNEGTVEVLFYDMLATSVDVQGDRATARSTFSELLRFPKKGSAVHLVGTYQDEFVKKGGQWLFRRRTVGQRFEEDVAVPQRVFSDGPSVQSVTPGAPGKVAPAK